MASRRLGIVWKPWISPRGICHSHPLHSNDPHLTSLHLPDPPIQLGVTAGKQNLPPTWRLHPAMQALVPCRMLWERVGPCLGELNAPLHPFPSYSRQHKCGMLHHPTKHKHQTITLPTTTSPLHHPHHPHSSIQSTCSWVRHPVTWNLTPT